MIILSCKESGVFSEQNQVEALSYEWPKYLASLFEPDDELPQGYRMRNGCK